MRPTERAIASAIPRSSDSGPGWAPGTSTNVTTGRPAALRELHEAHRLAVALGVRHAEVAPHVLLGVGALLLADHDHAPALDPREARDDRLVVAEQPVAVELDELVGDLGDELEGPRAAQVARELDAGPDDGLLVDRAARRRAGSRPSAASRPRPRIRSTTGGLRLGGREEAQDLGELAAQVGPLRRRGRRSRGGTGTRSAGSPAAAPGRSSPAPTRAPANPIRALGSARLTSPIAAYEANTPPVVGSDMTDTYGTRAARSRSRAAIVLASCISASVPSCIRAPPDAETMTSGTRSASAASAARATFSPTTAPIDPPMNPKSMTRIAIRWASIRPNPQTAASRRPVASWAAATRSGYAFWSTNPSGSSDTRPGVALLERVLVEQLRQADRRRQPEVVAARRAHAHRLLELLVEQLLLARRAARPHRLGVGLAAGAEGREAAGHQDRGPARPPATASRPPAPRRRRAARAAGRPPGDPRDADERERGRRDRAADEQRPAGAGEPRVDVEDRVVGRDRASRRGSRRAAGRPGVARGVRRAGTRRRRRRRGRGPSARARRARPGGPPAAPRTGTRGGRGRARAAGPRRRAGSRGRGRRRTARRRRRARPRRAAPRGSGRRRAPRRRSRSRPAGGRPSSARAPVLPQLLRDGASGRGGSAPGRRPRTGRARPRSRRRHLVDEPQERARGGGRRGGGRARAAPGPPRRGSRRAPARSSGSATTRPAPSATSSEDDGPAALRPALVGDHVARDPEQPDAERRGVRAVLAASPAPRTAAGRRGRA